MTPHVFFVQQMRLTRCYMNSLYEVRLKEISASKTYTGKANSEAKAQTSSIKHHMLIVVLWIHPSIELRSRLWIMP